MTTIPEDSSHLQYRLIIAMLSSSHLSERYRSMSLHNDYDNLYDRSDMPTLNDNPNEDEDDPDMPLLLLKSIIDMGRSSGRNALDSDNTVCPICYENCFDKSKPSKIMCFPCGNIHDPMHVECFEKCVSWSSKCPLCRKEVLFE